jgi:hypothetical protein
MSSPTDYALLAQLAHQTKKEFVALKTLKNNLTITLHTPNSSK